MISHPIYYHRSLIGDLLIVEWNVEQGEKRKKKQREMMKLLLWRIFYL